MFKTLHVLFVLGTDVTFTVGPDSPLRRLLKLCRGSFGVLTTVWAFKTTLSAYNARLDGERLEDPDSKIVLYGGLAASVAPDGLTLLGAARRPATGPPPPGDRPPGAPSPATVGEYLVLVANMVFCGYLIHTQCVDLTTQPEYDPLHNTDDNLRQAAWLLAGRFIALHIPPLVGFMFTQTPNGARMVANPLLHGTVVTTRFGALTAGLVLHCLAGFDHLT